MRINRILILSIFTTLNIFFNSHIFSLTDQEIKKIDSLYAENINNLGISRIRTENDKLYFDIWSLDENLSTSFQIDDFDIVLNIVLPSAEQAIKQLQPHPWFYYSYAVKQKAKIINQKDNLKSKDNAIMEISICDSHSIELSFFPLPSKKFPLNDKYPYFLLVHPHNLYMNEELGKSFIPFLNEEKLNKHIFFEAPGYPLNLIEHAPVDEKSLFWNPIKGIILDSLGNSDIHIATGGMFHFSNKREFTKKIILAGGWLNLCFARMIVSINESFYNSDATHLTYLIPIELITASKPITSTDSKDFVESYRQRLHELSEMMGYDHSKLKITFSTNEFAYKNISELKNILLTYNPKTKVDGRKVIHLAFIKKSTN